MNSILIKYNTLLFMYPPAIYPERLNSTIIKLCNFYNFVLSATNKSNVYTHATHILILIFKFLLHVHV